MNTIIETLEQEQSKNFELMKQAQTLLRNTEKAIANGNTPLVPPSRILATIEYCQGYNTAIYTAITLLSEKEN